MDNRAPILRWQGVASFGEFGDFEAYSGGGLQITNTPYTPAGERSAKMLPGTYALSSVTLSRAFDPLKDKALEAYCKAYAAGFESPRSIIIRFLTPQGIVTGTATYAVAQLTEYAPPDLQAGDSGTAEVRCTFDVSNKTF